MRLQALVETSRLRFAPTPLLAARHEVESNAEDNWAEVCVNLPARAGLELLGESAHMLRTAMRRGQVIMTVQLLPHGHVATSSLHSATSLHFGRSRHSGTTGLLPSMQEEEVEEQVAVGEQQDNDATHSQDNDTTQCATVLTIQGRVEALEDIHTYFGEWASLMQQQVVQHLELQHLRLQQVRLLDPQFGVRQDGVRQDGAPISQPVSAHRRCLSSSCLSSSGADTMSDSMGDVMAGDVMAGLPTRRMQLGIICTKTDVAKKSPGVGALLSIPHTLHLPIL